MRVLLTGATGFVGRHLLPELAVRHEVMALARRPPADGPVGVAWVRGDLEQLDPGSLPRGIEVVIHEASRIDDPFGRDPSLTELTPINVTGTVRLLEWAAGAGVRRFVHGSTGGIAGAGPPGAAMRETARARPPNPYNLTKHLAEQALLAYDWPFEACSLRYYAPYARDGSNPLIAHLLGCLDRGDPIEVGADDGPWMNPIHISDAVTLTVRAAEMARAPRLVNVAGPDVVSRVTFVEHLAGAVGRTASFQRGGEPSPSWVADISRLRRTLGDPLVGVAEGIAREWAARDVTRSRAPPAPAMHTPRRSAGATRTASA
jgi:nucleoside-diphosphate-sugar epimerase